MQQKLDRFQGLSLFWESWLALVVFRIHVRFGASAICGEQFRCWSGSISRSCAKKNFSVPRSNIETRVEHRNGLIFSTHARADDTRLHRCQRRRFHVIFEVTFGVAFESIFVDSARTYVSVRSLAHRANFTRCHSLSLIHI